MLFTEIHTGSTIKAAFWRNAAKLHFRDSLISTAAPISSSRRRSGPSRSTDPEQIHVDLAGADEPERPVTYYIDDVSVLVGQVGNLRADWQSAPSRRVLATRAQDSILPHKYKQIP